ncbi:RNA-directed DNA polymerase (Reverse transcriptase), Ribonuclease H [Gossypium australe]|uniref:RNA-directed DNA polymerase (Reverse transcriptase), Ribonuclease H n=1 Tax=Gossypium australe TaxID=47621 RepID=A0A5B6WJL7_9ROSI|nr:RNA-directed DNA polymerase (Reverse transcriptase), Ribonuclease H [Gossypium australe]
MCLEEDFEGDRDCNLSPDLLRMVKIAACITAETKRDLIELLQEFKDVFVWSYQDMLGLSTNIVVYQLPIKEKCIPVQQKLRRIRPDVLLKIKEEPISSPSIKKDEKVRMCVDYRDLNKVSPIASYRHISGQHGRLLTFFLHG